MLEGLKGDAGEVTRLTQGVALDTPPGLDRVGALGDSATDSTTVRRVATQASLDASRPDRSRVRELPARPVRTDSNGVQQRLQAAYTRGRPDGGAWTARTLAQAAGCGRSTAAAFLQARREPREEERS
jgi:hypothetical protein